MHILRHYTFTLCLLLGIILGGLAGVLFGERATLVQPIGELFLNLMFVVIVPLVFLSIASSIADMRQMSRLGKIMGTVFSVFIATALFAALIGFVATHLFNPFHNVDTQSLIAHLPPAPQEQSKGLGEVIVSTFTVPDFLQLFTKSNLLPLIVFSILFGLATAFSGEQGRPVAQFLSAGTTVILRMVKIIMYAAPLGLGCYFAATVGALGANHPRLSECLLAVRGADGDLLLRRQYAVRLYRRRAPRRSPVLGQRIYTGHHRHRHRFQRRLHSGQPGGQQENGRTGGYRRDGDPAGCQHP